MKIYAFKYLWSDKVFVGVMAQDLLDDPATRDAVVTSPNGFYAVDYSALGLKMVELEEWNARGLAAIKGNDRVNSARGTLEFPALFNQHLSLFNEWRLGI
jgi:hypothetical protein